MYAFILWINCTKVLFTCNIYFSGILNVLFQCIETKVHMIKYHENIRIAIVFNQKIGSIHEWLLCFTGIMVNICITSSHEWHLATEERIIGGETTSIEVSLQLSLSLVNYQVISPFIYLSRWCDLRCIIDTSQYRQVYTLHRQRLHVCIIHSKLNLILMHCAIEYCPLVFMHFM